MLAPAADRRLLLVALASGTLLNPLNSSMIAVALTGIQRDFALSFPTVSWLVSVFYVASAVAHPIGGRIGDRFGSRRTFLAGLGVVAVSCATAATARSFGVLLSSRVLQAVGTSMLFPAAMRTVGVLQDGREAALGTMRVFSSSASAVGPSLGGLLVSVAGWWTIFAVNLPFVALSGLLGTRLLPPDQPERRPRLARRAPRRGGGRMLPVAYVQFALVNVVFYSALFGMPTYLQQGGGLSPSATGAVMVALSGCGIVGSIGAARALPRLGAWRALIVGSCVLAGGVGTLTAAGHGLAPIVVALALIGFSNGFHNLGLQVATYTLAPAERLGTASGVLMSGRYVGAILATALLGTLFATTIDAGQMRLLAGLLATLAVAILTLTLVFRGV